MIISIGSAEYLPLRRLIALLSLIYLFTLAACSQKNETSPSKYKQTILKPAENGEPAKQLTVKDREFWWRLKAETLPVEDLGNRESYDKPRFQFMGSYGGDDLVSMKIDGTDLRRVFDWSWLEIKDRYIVDYPRRSKDNRYLAISTGSSMGQNILIIDLKKRAVIRLGDGFGPTNFQWSFDSNILYYYVNYALKSYNVLTGEKKSFELNPKNLRVIDNDVLVLYDKKSVAFQTLDGKAVKRFEYPHRKKKYAFTLDFFTSSDGSLVVYNFGDCFIVDTETFSIIHQGDMHCFDPVVDRKKEYLYWISSGSIVKTILLTHKSGIIFPARARYLELYSQ